MKTEKELRHIRMVIQLEDYTFETNDKIITKVKRLIENDKQFLLERIDIQDLKEVSK